MYAMQGCSRPTWTIAGTASYAGLSRPRTTAWENVCWGYQAYQRRTQLSKVVLSLRFSRTVW